MAWFWQLAALRLHAISYTIFAAGPSPLVTLSPSLLPSSNAVSATGLTGRRETIWLATRGAALMFAARNLGAGSARCLYILHVPCPVACLKWPFLCPNSRKQSILIAVRLSVLYTCTCYMFLADSEPGSWGRQKHPVDLTDRLSAWAVLGAAGRKQLHDWRRGELCRLHHQLLRLLGAVLRDGSMTLHAFTCPCLRLRALSRGDADLAASRS